MGGKKKKKKEFEGFFLFFLKELFYKEVFSLKNIPIYHAYISIYYSLKMEKKKF